ncbi:MAG: sugar ABC transporter permease [Propionibacteriaceae bacterium]|jgi:N,N'-diacetylchitobiose transport system permease protein|nr:sugar ABC transporter permease [Propionibacteriaceae bacterium]
MAKQTAATAPALKPPQVRLSKINRPGRFTPYVLLVPAIVVLLVALAYPVGWQIVTSLQHYGLKQQFGQPPEFVGAENYLSIFSDVQIWAVIIRSILFCLVNAVLTVVIGVLLSLLMNAVTKTARLVLQISLLFAWAMPVVAAMTVWLWLFNWHHGVVNWLLGDSFTGHNWLEDPLSFFMVATIIVVWMSVPFVAFSVYAGLTQVSGEVLEAAQLDGADGFKRFTNIILPMIRPVLMIVFLLQIIWDLRVFTQIQMLQDAGADYTSTNLLGTFIYRTGVGAGDFGMAAAMSVFVLILTMALSAPYVRSLIKEEG